MTWQVRHVTPPDAEAWLRMRLALWPAEPGEHRADIERFFAGDRREPREVLLVEDAEPGPVGFAELSIRNIVDGCDTGEVGYLEGWYVEPAVRRRGAGRALVEGAERWARSEGCIEFASDVLVENTESLAAHRALGFEETSRVCTFRKSISASPGQAGPEFRANDEIAVHVPDPAAAEAFYASVLGCVVVNRTPACVSLRNGALRIYLLRDPERVHDAVIPSFDVPDRRAALARLADAGCTFVPVGPHAPGEVYVCDPHGVVFDVVERRR